MEFKKRKTKKVKIKQSADEKKLNKSNNESDRIKMKHSIPASRKMRSERNESQTKNSVRKFRLIEGGLIKNAKRRKHSLIFAVVTVLIIVAVIIVNAVLPTGLVEWSQNEFSTLGSDGGLPKTVSGDRIDDLRSRDGELIIMSESYMYAYNNGGKCITTVQHGYNAPRLEISATRTLIYDRGSFGLRVDSLYTNFIETQLENKIITADICDKGYVAVATDSTDYSAEVTVYNDEFNTLFRWSTASGQISSLKLSPNGKYLAASVVSGKNGDYTSEVSIFDIKSGVRKFTKVYDGSMFVKSSADKRFVTFIGIDECVSVGWDGTNERINDFYRLEYFDSDMNDNMVAVYHPDGDDRHYTVAVLDSSGNVKTSVVLQGSADRVCANDDAIYTYNAGLVNKYDFSGSKLTSFNVGYEYVFMTSHKKGVGITHDMKLDYYT